MNLKLKRTTRTAFSEEILIFDTDYRDENEAAVNIGKADVHYLDEQIVGTLLIWQEFATGYNRSHGPGSTETMDTLIDAIMTEISEPLGLPGEYGIEVYFPSVQNYQFISSYEDGDEEAEEGDEENSILSSDSLPDDETNQAEEQDKDDSFLKQLRSRT